MTTSALPIKFLKLLATRPAQTISVVRMVLLFYVARLQRVIWPRLLRGVELGCNVRLQRNSSVMAEAPNASIAIGAHSIVYERAKVEAYGRGEISLGEASILGDIRISSRHSIKIGRRFLSSWNVFIQDFDPHPVDPGRRSRQVNNMAADFFPRFGSQELARSLDADWNFPGEPIEIGDDVWIGANATVLKGARIGSGCVVATGAVVLRGEYPAGSLIAGNPARVIRTLDKNDSIRAA